MTADLAPHIGEIARILLGVPSPKHSTRSQLRWGQNGSVAVEIAGPEAGAWFDHEAGVGGGAWELLRLKGGLSDEDIPDWLDRHGFGRRDTARNGFKIEAAYPYVDQNGKLLFEVVRLVPKTFRQRRPDGVGGWIWELKGVSRVPYRLPELVKAALDTPIWVVEGEKDADRLREWGLVATTCPGGAGKWRPEYNEYFRGRRIAILPDNDDAGRQHAQDVARHLVGVAADVRILELQGLPDKGDISDWITAGGTQSDLETLLEVTEPYVAHPSDDAAPGDDAAPSDDQKWRAYVAERLPLRKWLDRDTPPPDFVLGEVISTTTRLLLVAPTGLGKTNFGLAVGTAVATGTVGFLHWRIPAARRVLYVDGEMSDRLMKQRAMDACRRNAAAPENNLFILSREDFPDMPALNTAAGQRFIDRIIEAIGGVDLVIFDNIQALLTGDMKDEEPWQHTLPWVRELTRRKIGQLWVHHTGHDESHSYGTKTREWQLDTVMLLERVERPDADISFRLTFTKARERYADNRADFEPALITLVDDAWTSERGEPARTTKKKSATDLALDVLKDEIVRGNGTVPAQSERIPHLVACITVGAWRKAYEQRSAHESKEAAERAFYRAAKDLIEKRKLVAKHDLWVWPV